MEHPPKNTPTHQRLKHFIPEHLLRPRYHHSCLAISASDLFFPAESKREDAIKEFIRDENLNLISVVDDLLVHFNYKKNLSLVRLTVEKSWGHAIAVYESEIRGLALQLLRDLKPSHKTIQEIEYHEDITFYSLNTIQQLIPAARYFERTPPSFGDKNLEALKGWAYAQKTGKKYSEVEQMVLEKYNKKYNIKRSKNELFTLAKTDPEIQRMCSTLLKFFDMIYESMESCDDDEHYEQGLAILLG